MPSDEISGSQRQNEPISTQRHSGALRGTPVHSETLRCTRIGCNHLRNLGQIVIFKSQPHHLLLRRPTREVDNLPIGDAIRYKIQSDTIGCNQIQSQSDTIRCNRMQTDAMIQSDKIRCVQRQAEASSGNHLLLGEQAIGQCDEIVLFRAQSALVPPDAPGHRCRALRQASAIGATSGAISDAIFPY